MIQLFFLALSIIPFALLYGSEGLSNPDSALRNLMIRAINQMGHDPRNYSLKIRPHTIPKERLGINRQNSYILAYCKHCLLPAHHFHNCKHTIVLCSTLQEWFLEAKKTGYALYTFTDAHDTTQVTVTMERTLVNQMIMAIVQHEAQHGQQQYERKQRIKQKYLPPFSFEEKKTNEKDADNHVSLLFNRLNGLQAIFEIKILEMFYAGFSHNIMEVRSQKRMARDLITAFHAINPKNEHLSDLERIQQIMQRTAKITGSDAPKKSLDISIFKRRDQNEPYTLKLQSQATDNINKVLLYQEPVINDEL